MSSFRCHLKIPAKIQASAESFSSQIPTGFFFFPSLPPPLLLPLPPSSSSSSSSYLSSLSPAPFAISSLGVILYQMVFGDYPYNVGGESEAMLLK